MKKSLFILTYLLLASIAGFALPNASVLLQHKGFVTVYHQDSLNVALNDAVDGDTVFLSKGTFPGFTVDKQITIRGTGDDQTIITGMITVAIPDSVTLNATVLEGLYIKGYYYGTDDNYSIRVTTPLVGFKVKQCHFESMVFDRTMYDVIIDRCRCRKFLYLHNSVVKSLRANNSRIEQLRFVALNSVYGANSTKDITFVNCNIHTFYNFENFKGTLINSITGYGRTGSQVTFSSCSFINTLVCDYRLTFDGTCYKENVWTNGNTKLVGDGLGCMFSDEELIENGYIGNDGTVIGSNGGATPYTLTLAVPFVTSSDVKLDAEQRKLNVSLTLSEQ